MVEIAAERNNVRFNTKTDLLGGAVLTLHVHFAQRQNHCKVGLETARMGQESETKYNGQCSRHRSIIYYESTRSSYCNKMIEQSKYAKEYHDKERNWKMAR